MAYLDETGLDYLWGKTKSLVSSSGGGGGLTVLYDNSSGTTGTITCSDILTNYQLLAIRFTPDITSGGEPGTSLVCPIRGEYFIGYKQGGVSMTRIKSIADTTVNIYPAYRIYKIWGLK